MTITEAHLKSTHQVASDVKEVFGVCKETIFPAGAENLPTTNSPKECLTKCFMLVNCRVSPIVFKRCPDVLLCTHTEGDQSQRPLQ